ncbi:MAG: hypothetical protein CL910_18670 [Deltaproteobacteria bacterium]|jgi:predicted RNA-binding protein with PIN domain|nr:hypothetical protein [Deltaproteobacteria bacterium]
MEEPERWLVDGFNVLHVGILSGRERGRWWGGEARTRLLTRIAGFDGEGELCVVFDGPEPQEPGAQAPNARTRVVFAPSADEWLLAEVRGSRAPGTLAVVTADRKLADRARHRGARVVSPRDFLARCPSSE